MMTTGVLRQKVDQFLVDWETEEVEGRTEVIQCLTDSVVVWAEEVVDHLDGTR